MIYYTNLVPILDYLVNRTKYIFGDIRLVLNEGVEKLEIFDFEKMKK